MCAYEVDIPKPDFKDPISWATVKQTRIDWLRAVCLQVGFDASKVILWESLGDLYGDDAGFFGLYLMPDYADRMRQNCEIVMNIRIHTPEIPEYIRDQLAQVKDYILAIDWNTDAGYTEAKAYYMKHVADFIQLQIAVHEEFQEAQQYHEIVDQFLSHDWQDFVHGFHL